MTYRERWDRVSHMNACRDAKRRDRDAPTGSATIRKVSREEQAWREAELDDLDRWLAKVRFEMRQSMLEFRQALERLHPNYEQLDEIPF